MSVYLNDVGPVVVVVVVAAAAAAETWASNKRLSLKRNNSIVVSVQPVVERCNLIASLGQSLVSRRRRILSQRFGQKWALQAEARLKLLLLT